MTSSWKASGWWEGLASPGGGGHKSELVAPTTGRTTAPRLDGAPEISPIRKQPSNMGHLGSLGFPSQLRNSHS